MKTTELQQNRIVGYPNWYRDDKVAEFKTTELLRDNKVEISNGRISTMCDASKLEPIQLTVKWLVKSKAKKVANTYILDRFLFVWKPEYGYWYVMDLDSLAYLTKIEFVHELQNFYFAMQGEELKI